jgi:hypothetical protein
MRSLPKTTYSWDKFGEIKFWHWILAFFGTGFALFGSGFSHPWHSFWPFLPSLCPFCQILVSFGLTIFTVLAPHHKPTPMNSSCRSRQFVDGRGKTPPN